MAYGVTAYSSSAQAVTGQKKRDVADKLRFMAQGAGILNIVSAGKLSMPDETVTSKGMFSKRRVKNKKFECFVQSPMAIEFEVVSFSDTTLVVTSADGISTGCKYSLMNTSHAQKVTCNIDSISTVTFTVTSYGPTAFAANAGDKLICLSSHFEQYSTDPAIIYQDPTNTYNLTHIFRFATGISGTALAEQYHGTSDKWKDLIKNTNYDAVRKIGNTLLFDNKPSSGETTTSGAGHAFGSLDGIYQWVSNEYDCSGSFTYENWIGELGTKFDASVKPKDTKLMLCGWNVWSQILPWQQEGLEVKSGTYEKFGHESYKILSARGWIEVVILDAFDAGDMEHEALIITPERWQYCHLGDRDINLYQGDKRVGIGDNDLDGRIVDLMGEVSIAPDDNGANGLVIKNIP